MELGRNAKVVRPLVWALVSCVLCVVVVLLSMHGTEGHLTYSLDDTYIHMAMAKTLAFDGVWGVQPGEFAFCSSSPLWTVVLALAYKLFGCPVWLPGVLSIICASSAMGFWAVMLRRERLPLRAVCLAFAFLAVPMTIVGPLGMEHSAHVLAVILLCASFIHAQSGLGSLPAAGLWLAIFGACATALRVETLFLALPMVAVLTFGRQWRLAAILLVAVAVPMALYGAYALANGGHLLPNSLLLKGSRHGLMSLVKTVCHLPFDIHKSNVHLYAMAMLMLVVAIFRRGEQRKTAACVFVAIGGQMVFAQCPNFFRYDAYLVAASATVLFADIRRDQPSVKFPRMHNAVLVASLALAIPWLGLRGAWATMRAVQAPANIYGQQVQMARIFASLPEDDKGPVAINDLGCMALMSDVPVLDLWGLGTQEIAELKIEGCYSADMLANVFAKRGVRYVAVFKEWVPRSILPAWVIPVGRLSISDNHVCVSPDVWFYATSPTSADALRAHLAKCATSLPAQTSITLIPED